MSEDAASLHIELLAMQLQQSPERAFASATAAAHGGHLAAQLLLAQMHMEGKGTRVDPETAVLWYSVAANQGSATAMNLLGRCHELGQGTPPSPALAVVWYRRAADAGLDWACTTWPT